MPGKVGFLSLVLAYIVHLVEVGDLGTVLELPRLWSTALYLWTVWAACVVANYISTPIEVHSLMCKHVQSYTLVGGGGWI